jgi:hypothetical protein
VHPSAQFRFDGFQLGCHTFADCLPQYRELARLVYGSASVRETQKVKGFRLPFPIPLSIFDGKSPELYQARLFRMQFQPELSQPFPQLLQESLRYFPVLEPDDEVSRPGESHPEPLSEPYLNLSAHTAPAMEPRRTPICQCAHNFGSRLEIRATQCVALRK